MPLDTQPLSPVRRILMFAVLLALFAGSLGFAQFLVNRRNAPPPVTLNVDNLGFTTPVQPEDEDEVAARRGTVDKQPRLVQLFAIPIPRHLASNETVAIAVDLYRQITDVPPDDTDLQHTLLNRPAIQLSGADPEDHFTILRFTILGSHGIAISYSGLLPYTDADKAAFDAICANGIRQQK